jgi:hypothetical protein
VGAPLASVAVTRPVAARLLFRRSVGLSILHMAVRPDVSTVGLGLAALCRFRYAACGGRPRGRTWRSCSTPEGGLRCGASIAVLVE